jgi:hypothetical protein
MKTCWDMVADINRDHSYHGMTLIRQRVSKRAKLVVDLYAYFEWLVTKFSCWIQKKLPGYPVAPAQEVVPIHQLTGSQYQE